MDTNLRIRIRERWMRAAVLVVSVFALLVPLGVSAANRAADASCWPPELQEMCKRAKGRFDLDPECGSDWGRCYAGAEPIPIQIKLPGLEKQEVRDFAQYIQVFYVWAVRVAAILAVVVIMVGGLLWLTSAGAERLGKAKELIGNAVIGLLIAVFSYVILQTINPDLVRLSLPRVKILRPLALGAKFCDEIARQAAAQNLPLVRFAQAEGGTYSLTLPTESLSDASDPRSCGKTLYPDPGATTSRSCIATSCPTRNVCVPEGGATYRCVEGVMGGQINYEGGAFVDEMKLMVLCRDGSRDDIAGFDVEEGKTERGVQKFAIKTLTRETLDALGACGGRANQRGFYLDVEVNDTDWKWWSFGATYDDWYSVGKSSCNGAAKPFMGTDDGKPSTHPRHINWVQVPDSEFWPAGELIPEAINATRTSVVCNFNVNPEAFRPRVGGSAGGSG